MSTLIRNNNIQLVKLSVPEDASRGEIRIVDWKPTNWTREKNTELFIMRKIITQWYLLRSVHNAVQVNCN